MLKSYGLANREKKIPNTTGTKFNLGSMNKSFTQVAIAQLAAEGKLSLKDPIKKFLPDYPNKEAAEKVTVEQLLTMSSGIGDFFNERYEATPKKKLNSISAYLPLFADKPLAFEPGSKRRTPTVGTSSSARSSRRSRGWITTRTSGRIYSHRRGCRGRIRSKRMP